MFATFNKPPASIKHPLPPPNVFEINKPPGDTMEDLRYFP